jgi:hypothetical protein
VILNVIHDHQNSLDSTFCCSFLYLNYFVGMVCYISVSQSSAQFSECKAVYYYTEYSVLISSERRIKEGVKMLLSYRFVIGMLQLPFYFPPSLSHPNPDIDVWHQFLVRLYQLNFTCKAQCQIINQYR